MAVASNKATDAPPRVSSRAAAVPMMPPPMTATSTGRPSLTVIQLVTGARLAPYPPDGYRDEDPPHETPDPSLSARRSGGQPGQVDG